MKRSKCESVATRNLTSRLSVVLPAEPVWYVRKNSKLREKFRKAKTSSSNQHSTATGILLVPLNELLPIGWQGVVLTEDVLLKHLAHRIRSLHVHDDLPDHLKDQTGKNQNGVVLQGARQILVHAFAAQVEANENHQHNYPGEADWQRK